MLTLDGLMRGFRTDRIDGICAIALRAAALFSLLVAGSPFVCAQQPGGVQDTEERGLRQLINETRDSIAAEKWLEAAERFDTAWKAACESGDPLMTLSGTDVRQLLPGQTEEYAGGKAQLERLYQDAPEGFRREYAEQFSEVAETQIRKAIESGDLYELRSLSLRYSFMDAAQKGYEVLTRVSIDRGDFQEAALLLGRLERMSEISKSRPNEDRLVMLAMCFARAGLSADARDSLQRLRTLPAAGRKENLPDLDSSEQVTRWINRVSGVDENAATAFEWDQPGGNYRRSSLQDRAPASLKSAWSSTVYSMNDVLYADQYNELLSQIQRELERQFVRSLPDNKTVIPTPQPLIHKDLAIVRTPFGVRAVRQSSGELVWEVSQPDGEVRSVLDRHVAKDGNRRDEDMISYIQYMEPWMLLMWHTMRTNTASQMSINGRTLFVVDESTTATWDDGLELGFGDTTSLNIPANFIRAYDVETGLFLWEIGGKSQMTAQPAGKGNLLSGFYFLGAPLVLGERTYVLAESGEGIFLIQIVPPSASSGSTNPSIARSQILTVPKFKLPQHPVRKFAGLMPSFAQGLLICPTCDERIVAVSAEDHSLRWVFRYGASIRRQEIGGDAPVLFGGRDVFDSSRIDMEARWIDTLPRIVNNRVLVTPRDSDQLYCLDLLTGREIWKAARSGFHGIGATTEDTVILIGNQRVSSFKLEDGTENWTAPISDGIVCGTPSCNGRLLQVPVSDPAVLSFDVKTGQLLVRQPMPSGAIPGNLLATSTGLLMQSVSTVTLFPRATGDSSIAEKSTELLLDGRLPEAIALLDQVAEAEPLKADLRNLMIEVMLRAMQSDFPKYRSLLPRVRQLTAAGNDDLDTASALHVLLGMNLPDVPTAAKLLQGEGKRFSDVLLELEARQITQAHELPLDEFQATLESLIAELPDARTQQIVTGLLHRTRASVLIASIRAGLMTRPHDEQRQVAIRLQKRAEETLQSLTTEQAQVQYVTDLMDCGLFESVLPLTSGGGMDRLRPHASLLQERLRLDMLSAGVDSEKSADDVIAEWLTRNNPDAARTLLHDIAQPGVAGSDERYRVVDDAARSAILANWKVGSEKFPAITSAWLMTPEVTESDDRTMLPQTKKSNLIPDQDIPLFGPPGIFRDWSFARNASPQGLGGDFIMAFDGDGVLRWRFKSISTSNPTETTYAARSWFVASGHLLILCENEMLTAIDASEATPTEPPRVMWTDFLARMAPDDAMDQYQSYVPPSDRVVQYSPMPSGYTPSGLIRLGTLPVLSGRRMTMLSAYTGQELWHLDGVSPDCVLLGHGDTVLLMSEQARQIEVRGVFDGTVRSVSRLPEWWGEAIANSGSSVRTIELEAGSESIWKVAMHGRSCVLFRLTDGASTLECRDLITDKVEWEMTLPEDTVFSNPVNDVVALLAEGKRLLLVQTDSGKTLADLSVTEVKNPYDLILRKTHGEYLILPAADPEPNEYPISNSIYVAGRMFAVNAESLELSWDKPLADRHIRTVVQEHGAILPNVPVLVLLGRGSKGSTTGGIRKVRYGAQLVDVHTGEDLYASDDVGITLNEHWLQIDASLKQLIVSFESRFLTLDYGEKK